MTTTQLTVTNSGQGSLRRRILRSRFVVALAGAAALGLGVPTTAGVLYIRPGTTKGAFRVEHAESFKGVTQVVIGQFSVAFMTKKVDYDGGGFLAANSVAKATGNLTGVSNADYQRITDAAYADFLTQLAAHGITVVDGAGLVADKYYAQVKSEAQGEKVTVALKKDDHGDALAFWPTQLGRNNNMMLNLRMMDMNMGRTYTAEYNYARTNKVPVLNVVYYIDFAKPAKSDGGGLLQSVSVKAGLAVSPFGTQVQLMDTNGKVGKMMLDVAVEEGGDFANIVETTSQLTKVTRVASVLGGAFGRARGDKGLASLGGGGMSAKFDYEVVDPAVYGDKVVSASNKTSDLVLRQMEEMR